jgi:hypothetical protein
MQRLSRDLFTVSAGALFVCYDQFEQHAVTLAVSLAMTRDTVHARSDIIGCHEAAGTEHSDGRVHRPASPDRIATRKVYAE